MRASERSAECTTPTSEYYVSVFISCDNSFTEVSTATNLLSERKSVEGKTLSNKTPGSSKSDRCSVLRESVSESAELSFQDCGEKTPHSQVVQDAEFALVSIGIALLRSHA